MLRVRKTQLRVLEEASIEEFHDRLLVAVQCKIRGDLNEEDLRYHITKQIRDAMSVGLRTERGVADYVVKNVTAELE